MKFRVGAVTDVGRARERNEDAYLVNDPLYAVADGMGGHRGGDVASTLALEVLAEMASRDSGETPLSRLVEEIKEANRRVMERGESERDLRGMGTTLTAFVAAGDRGYLAHVGDSRAYRLRDGSLQQLTEDHTLVQRMVREGRLTPEEAAHHPQRSILTRALGVEGDLDVDDLTLDLRDGDRLLLCTDGLSSMVPRARIQEILESEPDPQVASDLLVEEANGAGGDDNITVIVVDVIPDGEAGGAETAGEAPPRDAGSAGSPPRGRGGETAASRGPAGDGPVTAVIEDGRRAEAPGADGDEDEEGPAGEAEPAPRRGIRWRRVALWAAVLLVLVAGASAGGWLYVTSQWYVGDAEGRVAIYNGLPGEALGFPLSTLEETTDVPTAEATQLQTWSGLREGITANSLEEAQEIVEQVRQDVESAATAPPGVSP